MFRSLAGYLRRHQLALTKIAKKTLLALNAGPSTTMPVDITGSGIEVAASGASATVDFDVIARQLSAWGMTTPSKLGS
ncbi:MAG TPA: hypothetical protein VLU96_04440 [Gaiellaceae bacterium]|nr:hypothetical protein [Gaiellaceae bacterium]